MLIPIHPPGTVSIFTTITTITNTIKNITNAAVVTGLGIKMTTITMTITAVAMFRLTGKDPDTVDAAIEITIIKTKATNYR